MMKRFIVIALLVFAWIGCIHAYVQPIRVGLVLSLQTNKVKRDKSMDRFVDFYTGALLAVYEKQSLDCPIEIYTYDVGKSAQEMQQVLDSNSLASMDIIIGPTYPAQVSVMSDWTFMNEVLTIIPFASEIPELETNPFLLQFNPNPGEEAVALIDSIVQSGKPVRFVFVMAEESSVPGSVREVQQCVMNEGIEYVYTTTQQIMDDSLTSVLSDTVENILLLNTERFTNICNLMPYLERASQSKPLTLCSRYSWQNEKINIPQIFTSVFKCDVQVDSTRYDDMYHMFAGNARAMSHPYYDLLGYDIMTYALEVVSRLNDIDEERESDEIIQQFFMGMQSDMNFRRVGDIGGFINRNIYVKRL